MESLLCPVWLFLQSVTKGARTKIILSIRKLARRPETLADIEQVSDTLVLVL